MTALYLAAPLSAVANIQAFKLSLLAMGHSVVSTWHDDMTPGTVDPASPTLRREILAINCRDLSRAECVVALTDEGKPRSTLVEIGICLGQKKPVIWLAPIGLFSDHPLVTPCLNYQDVFAALRSVGERSETTGSTLCPGCLGAQTISDDGVETKCDQCEGLGVVPKGTP